MPHFAPGMKPELSLAVPCSHPLCVKEVIMQFILLSLAHVSSPGTAAAVPVVSPPVASAWLFVCRQLYKTGEGLLALEHSQLHLHVANTWRSVSGDFG